jgi:low affinity Fe/Cu permease
MKKNPPPKKPSWFTHFAKRAAFWTGKPITFLCAVLAIVIWGVTGPLFNFSDTWQLVINTSTTIITFLMVFLIQNTQNRDSEAIHIKLDELIRIFGKANNNLLNLEELDEEELEKIRSKFLKLAEVAQHHRPKRSS